MLFNSLHFLIFFPIVTLLYFILPRRMRWVWLLLASYYFYMSWNPKYAILIGISTFITWLSGISMEKFNKNNSDKIYLKKKKGIVALSFITNIGILFFYKYFDFILSNVNHLFNSIGVEIIEKPFDIILPVGISFYTFQALSYTMDVYRGDMKAEKNIFKYALFVSFFPQLVAGPIERSTNLLHQVNTVPLHSKFESKRVLHGLVLIIWGLVLKMIIADRIAILVNTVFDSYYIYSSYALIVAAIGFAIQIYCDFASYSTIAIGAAKVLGFELMENFDTPYFASSIKDFWRRWHISLSTWFRDYLYIPLGGNRHGKVRKNFNTLVVFTVSGLWHGANWTFVVWGLIHGIYQIIGEYLKPFKQKLNERIGTKTESFSYKLGQMLITFILVDIAWIFFRADTISDAFNYIYRIFTKVDLWSLFNGSLYTLGLDITEMNILVVAIAIMVLVDLLKYFKNIKIEEIWETQCLWFQWGMLLLGITSILIFGQYGAAFDPQQFIYFQF